MEKRAYWVVVKVGTDAIQTMLPSLYLFGNTRTVEKAYSSSPVTQCQKCWKYGHVKPLCKAEAPTCPLCSLQHMKVEHRCPNPSCPSGGNLKAILNCCLASPARCSNCGEAHSARSRDCSKRPPPPNVGPAPTHQESPVEIYPDQMDVQPKATRGDPPHQPAGRSDTRLQGLLPLFQEESRRATRTPLAAPPESKISLQVHPPPPIGRPVPQGPPALRQAQPGKMSHNSEASPPDPRPGHVLSIFQHNCLGSWDVFLSLFNSFASARDPPLIVCLQDPPVWRNGLPFFASFTSFGPLIPNRRPQVAFYAFRSLIAMARITPIFTSSSYHATVEISAHSLFGIKAEKFHIVNCYSVWGSTATERTVSPTLPLPSTVFPTLVVGDFNIHHPSADRIRRHNSSELKASFLYFSMAAEHGYTLLNTPGVYTRFPLPGSSRPSHLDRAFASTSLVPFFQDWSTDLPSTGSDHVPINITIAHPIRAPPPPAPNWFRTDWPTLEPLLKEVIIPPPPNLPTRYSLENWFDMNLNTLVALLKTHSPLRRPSIRVLGGSFGVRYSDS